MSTTNLDRLNNLSNESNSDQILNSNYSSTSSLASKTTTIDYSDEDGEKQNETTINDDQTDNYLLKKTKSFNENLVLNSTNNSSGIGLSISSPNSANDELESPELINKTNNRINMMTPSKLNNNCESNKNVNNLKMKRNLSNENLNYSSQTQTQTLSNDQLNQNKYLPNLNNFLSLPISLGTNINNLNGLINQNDYDPFGDYMGVDKMILQMAAANTSVNLDANKLKSPSNNDSNNEIQQQQFLAQAIAAIAAASLNNNGNNNSKLNNNNNNNSTSLSNTQNNDSNQKQNTNRSILENIEILNSKFMNQKQIETNDQNNNNYSNNKCDYNSPNISTNLKRQSMGIYPQSINYSTPIPMSPSASCNNTLNSRLNSTPNFLYGSSNNNSATTNCDFNKYSQRNCNTNNTNQSINNN